MTRHLLTAAALAFPLTIAAWLLWTVPMTGAIR